MRFLNSLSLGRCGVQLLYQYRNSHHHQQTLSLLSKAHLYSLRIQRDPHVSRNKITSWIKITLGLSFGGLIVYDGIVNDFIYVGATKRFLRSVKIVTLISIDYLNLMYIKRNHDDYEKLRKDVHLKSAKRILDGCLLNGGLYIKVGQGIAGLNNLLPSEYTVTLENLQDKCLPSTSKEVKNVFLQDFGKIPEEIFEEFNYEPVAAASLAQVFKARLKSGEDVAVKVQYCDLQRRFPSDLGTIIFLQDILELGFENYSFGWVFRSIRETLEKELDFIKEGKNAERCAKDLKHFNYIYVPKVHWNLTTTRILTLEWIDGCKITDLDQIKKYKLDIMELDEKLFNVFSEQIFSTGFIHADPHPGNIFVRKKKSGDAEIVLLDHGLYETLSSDIRQHLCQFWEATVLQDEENMKKTAKNLNVKRYKLLAEIIFQMPFIIEGAQLKSKVTEKDIKHLQDMAKNHSDIIMQTLKEMPINMILVLRNLNTIRGIGKDHGDPINRSKLMARYAQKCIYKNQNSFVAYIRWLFRRIHFEYCLLKLSIKVSAMSLYLSVLYKLGRSPESLNPYKNLPKYVKSLTSCTS